MILPASYHTGFAPRDGYPAYPELWRGCVGAWAPCLGPTGLTLRDWSGRQNHGTLTNMVPGDDWVVSGGRYALDFDAIDDQVSCGANVVTGGEITVFGWMNRRGVGSNNNNVICAKGSLSGNSTSTFALYYNETLGWSWFCVDNANSLIITRSLSSTAFNTWHFVCGTLSSSAIRLFINGVLVSSAAGGVVKTSTHTTVLGMSGGIGGNCILDSVGVVNRAMSAHEIRTLAARRGIAYEMYRPTYYAPQVTSARRRKILTGQV